MRELSMEMHPSHNRLRPALFTHSPAPGTASQDRRVRWYGLQWPDDRQWARVEAALPGRVGARAQNGGNARRFIDAVLWCTQTRSRWSDIPVEFGQWHTIYIRFGRWCDEGLWPAVIEALDELPEAKAALRERVDKYVSRSLARNERRRHLRDATAQD